MKKVGKRILTVLVILGIIKACSMLPQSPLGDQINEGIRKYRERIKKECEGALDVYF